MFRSEDRKLQCVGTLEHPTTLNPLGFRVEVGFREGSLNPTTLNSKQP